MDKSKTRRAGSRSRTPGRSKSATRGKSPGRDKSPAVNKKAPRSRSRDRLRSGSRDKLRSSSRERTRRGKSPMRSRSPLKKKIVKKKANSASLDEVINEVGRHVSRSKSRQRSASRTSVTRRKSARKLKAKEYKKGRKESDESDAGDPPEDWILGNGTKEPEQKEDFISTDTFDGARANEVEAERIMAVQYALPAFLALIKILTLPVLVLVLNLVCNRPMTENERYRFRWSFSIDDSCDVSKLWTDFFDVVPSGRESYIDTTTYLTCTLFYVVLAILDTVPLGSVVPGAAVLHGKRLTYRLGGIISFLFCGIAFYLIWRIGGPISLIYAKYIQLVSFAVIVSFVFSAVLYFRASSLPESCRDGGFGSSGHFQLEFAHGREMHPRVGSIDLKMLSWRIGKLTWFCLNLMFLAVSYEYYDEVDNMLLLAVVTQSLYIADALLFEENELYTNEFVSHGIGWNYVFHRQVFEPFVNTLTTKYLLEHREQRDDSVGVPLGLFVVGYLLYRVARKQKLQFLRNPDEFPDEKVVDASEGRRLLVSGCFAWVRSPENAAELLIIGSWSLMCGFSTALVYFPLIVKAMGVLVSAIFRSSTYKQKYGTAYDVYCSRVKYKLVPFIF